jgi:galactofuranose transport system permease protein
VTQEEREPSGVLDPVTARLAPQAEPQFEASVLGREDARERLIGLVQRSGAFVMLAVTLVAGAGIFGSSFATTDNLVRNIAAGSAFLALVAVGMTLVIVSGGIDLSVGSVLAMSAVLTTYAYTEWGTAAAIVVPLVAAAALGLVQGLLIARAGMAPFIVTLAGLLFARGVAFKLTNEGNETRHLDRSSFVATLGQGSVLGVPVPVAFALAAFIIGAIVLNRTRFGQALFAMGGSEDAAVLMGLPVRRIKTTLYVCSALLAGFAGMLIAARSSTGEPTAGNGLELQAIAAVVIGGTLLTGGVGTLSGTLAGVALLGVIRNLLNQVGTLSPYYQDVVSGTFLLVVVVVQAYLGRRSRR